MKPPREQVSHDSVYWMESSKRRQALEWLAREDLAPDERAGLETFVKRYRTGVGLPASERRALLAAFDRVAGRLERVRMPLRRPPAELGPTG